MSTEWKLVDVWACQFADRAAFEAYIADLPREDEDDPQSEFISDQCQPEFEPDTFAAMFHDEKSTDLATLLKDHPHAASYASAAAAAFEQTKVGAVNATITMEGAEVQKPRSLTRRAYRIEYLGRFPCHD